MLLRQLSQTAALTQLQTGQRAALWWWVFTGRRADGPTELYQISNTVRLRKHTNWTISV